MTAIVASRASGERGEAAQDDAVADLVLRTTDDDHRSVGHEVGRLPYWVPERIPCGAMRACGRAGRACENAAG